MRARGPTIPEAIRMLFGINVASDCTLLRQAANSLARVKVFEVDTVKTLERRERAALYLKPGQEIVLHNALILSAFFQKPKDVKKIFDDPAYRSDCAATVRAVLARRNSLLGEALQASNAITFADFIEDTQNDLRLVKVPNPFRVLPQVALGGDSSVLHALLAQAASLDAADSFLLAYLNGDWQTAGELSAQVESGSPDVLLLKAEVERRISEAHDFNDLLDVFRHR